jgi:hypothetical protein
MTRFLRHVRITLKTAKPVSSAKEETHRFSVNMKKPSHGVSLNYKMKK